MATSLASPSTAQLSNDDTKVYACITCVQRKVKCDKQYPSCTACIKSRLHCNYRHTPPPQRRKRKLESSQQILLDKIRSYEALLKSAGLPFEAHDDAEVANGIRTNAKVESEDRSLGHTPSNITAKEAVANTAKSLPHRGVMIPEYGGMRYYEHGLIGALGQEFRQIPINFVRHHNLADTIDAGSYETIFNSADMLRSSILTGSATTMVETKHHQPSPATTLKYWSIFMDNVHPLTKIIHAPSLQPIMTGTNSTSSTGTDALKYSIFACAVASLTDEECRRTFGESQSLLLYHWQSTTRSALSEASFLRVPNIDLLRAYVFFLTSMFSNAEPPSLWILMGSAVRMAQWQGLHRDAATLGLSPFDTEMRRRLWWYIVTLDGRLTEITGSESSILLSTDTVMPSNLDDDSLYPDMPRLPPGGPGASEMTFCLIRYEIARFLRENDPRLDGFEPQVTNSTGRRGAKRDISELENFLEDKFLRFCDPVVAVQFLTTTLTRSALCKLRQMAHRRKFRPNADSERTSQIEQTQTTLTIATRNVEYDNLIHTSRSLRRFLWHVHFYFPWGAPVIALKILGSATEWDDDKENAWLRIEELHEHHPEYRTRDQVIHLVFGPLTIKAWAAREAILMERGFPKQPTPPIIAALQDRQTAFRLRSSDSKAATTGPETEDLGLVDFSGFEPPELSNGTFDNIDYFSWV